MRPILFGGAVSSQVIRDSAIFRSLRSGQHNTQNPRKSHLPWSRNRRCHRGNNRRCCSIVTFCNITHLFAQRERNTRAGPPTPGLKKCVSPHDIRVVEVMRFLWRPRAVHACGLRRARFPPRLLQRRDTVLCVSTFADCARGATLVHVLRARRRHCNAGGGRARETRCS